MNIFLSISFNISFVQRMFWLRNKKITLNPCLNVPSVECLSMTQSKCFGHEECIVRGEQIL